MKIGIGKGIGMGNVKEHRGYLRFGRNDGRAKSATFSSLPVSLLPSLVYYNHSEEIIRLMDGPSDSIHHSREYFDATDGK